MLVISLAIIGYGVRLALDAAHHLNRYELRVGIFILLFGPIIVLPFLVVAINRFVPSERRRLQESSSRNRPARIRNNIRKREKLLRRMQFLKRHPSVVFLFILTALVVLTAMALCPDSMGKKDDVILLHLIGIVFGLGYVIMMILFLYTLITKRWESYMDESIRKLEARLAEARSVQAQL